MLQKGRAHCALPSGDLTFVLSFFDVSLSRGKLIAAGTRPFRLFCEPPNVHFSEGDLLYPLYEAKVSLAHPSPFPCNAFCDASYEGRCPVYALKMYCAQEIPLTQWDCSYALG